MLQEEEFHSEDEIVIKNVEKDNSRGGSVNIVSFDPELEFYVFCLTSKRPNYSSDYASDSNYVSDSNSAPKKSTPKKGRERNLRKTKSIPAR